MQTWYPTLFPTISPLSQATLSAIDIATIRRGCKKVIYKINTT